MGAGVNIIKIHYVKFSKNENRVLKEKKCYIAYNIHTYTRIHTRNTHIKENGNDLFCLSKKVPVFSELI